MAAMGLSRLNKVKIERTYIVGNVSRDTVWRDGERLGSFWGGAGLNVAAALVMSKVNSVLVSCINENDKVFLKAMLPECQFECYVNSEPACRFEMWYSQNCELKNIRCEYGIAERMNEFVSGLALQPGFYHVCCRNPLDPMPLLTRLIEMELPFSIDFIYSSCKRQVELARMLMASARCVFVNNAEYKVLNNTYEIGNIDLLIVTSGNTPVKVFEYGELVSEMPCQLGRTESQISVL